MDSFSGLPKFWVYARRNDTFYLLNKFLSVILAFALAWHTEKLKFEVTAYSKTLTTDEELEKSKKYNIFYWTLFIFYAFHAVDELIELYAVYFKREKGALGLLLELNYVLGVFLTGFLVKFIYWEDAVITGEYAKLYGWLKYQVIFFWVVCGFSVVMLLCMWKMQKDLTRTKQVAADDDNHKKQTTTIN